MTDLTGKKILMVVAPKQFRDEEFLQPKEVFETSGAKVVVASKGVKEATGMLGARVKVDVDLATVKADDYDAIVFVGGSGTMVYFVDQAALNLAKHASYQGKIIGAICIAPSILANAGILASKRATAFSSERGNLRKQGARFVNSSVVKDGKIITADGPQSAKAFGEQISQALGFK